MNFFQAQIMFMALAAGAGALALLALLTGAALIRLLWVRRHHTLTAAAPGDLTLALSLLTTKVPPPDSVRRPRPPQVTVPVRRAPLPSPAALPVREAQSDLVVIQIDAPEGPNQAERNVQRLIDYLKAQITPANLASSQNST
jgi:hypothetical protein